MVGFSDIATSMAEASLATYNQRDQRALYSRTLPSVTLALCLVFSCSKDKLAESVNGKMVEFANRGFRSLGLAMAEGDGSDGKTEFHMLGLMPMFDPPRVDTKSTIEYCHQQGIEVKMVTGDHLLIGKETARMLGMGDLMFASEVLIKVMVWGLHM